MNRQVDEWQEFQQSDHLPKFHYDHSLIDFGTGKTTIEDTHKEVSIIQTDIYQKK